MEPAAMLKAASRSVTSPAVSLSLFELGVNQIMNQRGRLSDK